MQLLQMPLGSNKYPTEFFQEKNKTFMIDRYSAYSNGGQKVVSGGKYYDMKTSENKMFLFGQKKEIISISTKGNGVYDNIFAGIADMSISGRIQRLLIESSRFMRIHVGALKTGTNFDELDKPKEIKEILGKITGKGWTEYFFNVNSTKELMTISKFYKLDYPIDEKIGKLVDKNRTAIRFRSYDLYEQGEGNFVELVPISIKVVDGKPKEIKLWTLERANDQDVPDIMKKIKKRDKKSSSEILTDSSGNKREFKEELDESLEEEIKNVFPEFEKEDFREFGKSYNSVFDEDIISCLRKKSCIPGTDVELKIFCKSKVAMKKIGVHVNNIPKDKIPPIPELPEGSLVRFYGKYLDMNNNEAGGIAGGVNDVYFINRDTDKVLDWMGIKKTKENENIIHFGVTYDNTGNLDIIRKKTYKYEAFSSLRRW